MGRSRRLPAEPFAVSIDALNDDGTGHARVGERALRVWDALPGEQVQARYLFGRKFRGQAQTLQVETASSQRVTPRCSSFGTCSACTLQHLAGDAQLQFKQQRLMDALAGADGLAPQRQLAPLAATPWHYRRKARLSVRHVPAKGRVLVGFRERDGRFVCDMLECHTLDQRLAAALPALSELLGGLDARATIPQLEAACGDQQVALVLRHLQPLSDHDVGQLLAFEQSSGLRLYLQPGGPDTVRPLRAEGPGLGYALPGFELWFEFEPMDFIQVNGALNALMVEQALDLLALEPGHRVLDLFCGLGNFSLPLARRAGQVLGMEGATGLVQRAQANARRNGLANATFLEADLYGDSLPQQWPTQSFDRILLDPPRSGAGALLPLLGNSGAGKIVYVSCNPLSLAADAGRLFHEFGYRLAAAGIMDMFPHTSHIEAMALFERG